MLLSREFKRGDVDATLAAAPVRIKDRFRMHRKTAVAIEPRAVSPRGSRTTKR